MAKAKKTAASKVRGKTKGSRGAAKTVAKTKAKTSPRKSASQGKTSSATLRNLGPAAEGGAVLEYKLFVEDSVRNLEDQVNYYIGKGWAPVGGVVVQSAGHYMQSMVRRES